MTIGIQGPAAGYWHHQDDSTQTATAQRATFTPTISNHVSQWLREKSSPKLQRLGQLIQDQRTKDLDWRQRRNESSMARRQSAGESTLRNELKAQRLQMKHIINKADSRQGMQESLQFANNQMAGTLKQRGYQPSAGLTKIAFPRAEAEYLSSPDGHRVRINYQQAPFLARAIGQSTSWQSDHGVTGVNKALQRTVQHGAVGVRNAALLAKQGFFKTAAFISHSDGEAETTFLRRADAASDARRLNNAALRGNVALDDEFIKVNERRSGAVKSTLTAKRYQPSQNFFGVSPAKTGWAARTTSEYFAGNDDIMQKRRWLASQVVGARNIVPSLKVYYHNWKMQSHAGGIPSHNQEAAGEANRKYFKHEAARFKAQYAIDTRNAALEGKLGDVTRNRQKEMMKRFDSEATASSRPASVAGDTSIVQLREDFDDARSVSSYGSALEYVDDPASPSRPPNDRGD